MDQHTRIFSNGFSVQQGSQFATLILSPSTTTIDIIVQSDSFLPSLLWKSIWEAMKQLCQENFQGIDLDFEYLCPTCTLDLCKPEPFDNIPIEKIEDDKGFSKEGMDKILDDEKRRCKNGHAFSKFQITGIRSISPLFIQFTEETPLYKVGFLEIQNNHDLLAVVGDNPIRFCNLFKELQLEARSISNRNLSPFETATYLLQTLHDSSRTSGLTLNSFFIQLSQLHAGIARTLKKSWCAVSKDV